MHALCTSMQAPVGWQRALGTSAQSDGYFCCPASRPLRIGQCQAQPGSGRRRRLLIAHADSSYGNRAGGGMYMSGSSNIASGANMIRAAVGIDLGTTTSAIAVARPDGRPVVVEDDLGRAVIPSVVFVRQDGSVLVGDEAAAAAESDPANAFYGIKRLMGRTYREVVQERDEQLPYTRSSLPTASLRPGELKPERRDAGLAGYDRQQRRFRSHLLVEGPGGCVQVACPALGRNLAPHEISSHLLRHLVSRARGFLERQIVRQQQQEEQGEGGVIETACGGGGGDGRSISTVEVLDAVITVPAHFGPAQRRAVSEAARAAGLQRVTLLQEPIAAAMAYGFGSPQVPYDVLLVFDLGGGTLDLTVVESFEGIMEVLSTSGDNFLGGDDFTAAVANWLALQMEGKGHHHHQQQQQQQLQEQQPESQPPLHGSDEINNSSTTTGTTYSSTSSTTIAASSSSSIASMTASTSQFTTSSAAASLALLRAAEAAKIALSDSVAATGTGRNSSNTSSSGSNSSSSSSSSSASATTTTGSSASGSSGSSSSSSVSVRVRVPICHHNQQQEQMMETELSLETFDDLVRPLLRRMWWPLEELAMATRTQLGGHLPPDLDPRGFESGSRSGFESGSSVSSSLSGSSWELEGPGRREGAVAWEFSIFPPQPAAVEAAAAGDHDCTTATAATAKYVAPPRRLTGLVLVGTATRLPVVRDYITTVTGLSVRQGVDPETAVALGAALHAGLMVGSVRRGIEMGDGGYVSDQHGRTSGFQVAAAGATPLAASDRSNTVAAVAAQADEPELVWEP